MKSNEPLRKVNPDKRANPDGVQRIDNPLSQLRQMLEKRHLAPGSPPAVPIMELSGWLLLVMRGVDSVAGFARYPSASRFCRSFACFASADFRDYSFPPPTASNRGQPRPPA